MPALLACLLLTTKRSGPYKSRIRAYVEPFRIIPSCALMFFTMRTDSSLFVAACILASWFIANSFGITAAARNRLDTPPAIKLDQYGAIPMADERRRLNKLARTLRLKTDFTSHIIVYGSAAAEVKEHIRRIRAYLVNKRGLNAYRVVTEGVPCRQDTRTELWIIPPGAVRPAPVDGPSITPCRPVGNES
jgi:hypothetical protein